MAVHLEHSLDYSGSAAAAAAVLKVCWHDQEAHVLIADHVSLSLGMVSGGGGGGGCIWMV